MAAAAAAALARHPDVLVRVWLSHKQRASLATIGWCATHDEYIPACVLCLPAVLA